MAAIWLAIVLPPVPAATSATPELERLACWAGGFTPRVSLAPPRAVLLEVGGCLRLFGGIERLCALVTEGLANQGTAAALAMAATPQAALWLAEGGAASLDNLSLAAISLPAGTAERLGRFGLATLGQVRRLPSAALGRRIGKAAVALIGRAYGELPDPRPDFVFPPRFEQTVDLPAAVENAPALLFAARRLTAALAGWLAARQQGLRRFRLDLLHRRGTTELLLNFGDAHRDAGRFERVLKERLDRLALTAPVEALRLVAEAVEDQPGFAGGLFDDPAARESMAALAERLRARLGDERVFGLAAAADHRPECATAHAAEGSGAAAAIPAGPRPFWLLPRPEPLAEVKGRPWRRGALQLLAGPERIESGWWDGGEGQGDLRRDYFVALAADGRWAWLFRELKAPGGWFLHGWFG